MGKILRSAFACVLECFRVLSSSNLVPLEIDKHPEPLFFEGKRVIMFERWTASDKVFSAQQPAKF